MQQHNSDILIEEEEEQRINMSKREEVILRYRFASFAYYQDGQKNEEFKQGAQNFEPPIYYVIE
jgi:hypothetical protein